MKLLPPMELPFSRLCHFLSGGCAARLDYRQMKGFLLQPAISSLSPPSSSLILHSSHWLSEQPRSDIAACCISIHVTISLFLCSALSIKVSFSPAIRVRHRLFDAKLAD